MLSHSVDFPPAEITLENVSKAQGVGAKPWPFSRRADWLGGSGQARVWCGLLLAARVLGAPSLTWPVAAQNQVLSSHPGSASDCGQALGRVGVRVSRAEGHVPPSAAALMGARNGLRVGWTRRVAEKSWPRGCGLGQERTEGPLPETAQERMTRVRGLGHGQGPWEVARVRLQVRTQERGRSRRRWGPSLCMLLEIPQGMAVNADQHQDQATGTVQGGDSLEPQGRRVLGPGCSDQRSVQLPVLITFFIYQILGCFHISGALPAGERLSLPGVGS